MVVKVMLVDDHTMFREGLKMSLSIYPDISIIGEASNGLEAIEKNSQLKPDVVLLDISMPKMNGVEAISRLYEQDKKINILILTMHKSNAYLERFLKLGIKGYVTKDSPPEELALAIRQVAEGHCYIGSGLKEEQSKSELNVLSRRELEVLKLISVSSRNKDIAKTLGLSVRTIEKHRTSLMKKLNTDNVAGLVERLHLFFEL